MKHLQENGFPKEFLWGASISAIQAEGAAFEDGRGLTARDIKNPFPGTADTSVASDFYHRFREDIKLLAEMGLKTFRFSISWPRVLPNGIGKVNEKGIDFYHQVIDECLKYKIEPLITIHHMDMPLALEEQGGWGNPDSVKWFEEYSKLLFKNYGAKVKYWLTINEQNCMVYLAEAYHLMKFPKNCTNKKKIIYQQCHRMFVAQAKAIIACHSMCPGAMIGPAPNLSLVYPASCKPEDILSAQNYNAMRNWLYLDVPVYGRYNEIVWEWLKENDAVPEFEPGDEEILKKGKADFIAFNYYNTLTSEWDDGTRKLTTATDQQTARGENGMFRGCPNPYLEKTEFGWEIDPVGIRATIRETYSRYHLPIIITENGIGGNDALTEDGKVHDQYRIEYLKKHIEQLQLAIADGCEVFGFCPWSAIDVVSTHQGFKKRYGFIFVNREEEDLKDLARYKKDSYLWYQKVIETNGKGLK